MTGSNRAADALALAATDEKDLSTAQSPTQTDPRLPVPDGLAGRPQRTQAPPRQGTEAPDGLDSAETARLADERRFGFGTADRLRRRAEFARVQRHGARFQTAHFVVYAAHPTDEMLSKDGARPRLGMAVARRIGGAVVRNRVKRRVRECFRLELRRLLPANTDLVVIARIGAGELESAAIAAELKTAISNLSNLGRRLGAAGANLSARSSTNPGANRSGS